MDGRVFVLPVSGGVGLYPSCFGGVGVGLYPSCFWWSGCGFLSFLYLTEWLDGFVSILFLVKWVNGWGGGVLLSGVPQEVGAEGVGWGGGREKEEEKGHKTKRTC